MLWIRGNLLFQMHVFLGKTFCKLFKKYIQENNIETVITTGPPHSLHLIGLHLKRQLGINWIADFRDPWTTIGYHKALKLSNWAAKT